MIANVGERLDYYKVSTGSRLYSLRQVRQRLQGVDKPRLLDRVERAIQANEEAARLNYDWRMRKRQKPLGRKGAAEVDAKVDKMLSAIHSAIEGYLVFDDQPALVEAATALKTAVFPEGVYPISSIKYEDQHAATNELLGRLDGELDAHVATLNLQPHVDRLRKLNQEFGRALASSGQGQLSFDKVEAARRAGSNAFHVVIATILGDYAEDLETLARLLGPIEEQNERARMYYKRRGTMPHVDPDTGELVEDDEDEPAVDDEPDVDPDADA